MENLGSRAIWGSTALVARISILRSAYSLNHMEQPPVLGIFDLIFAFAYVGGDRIEVGSHGGIPWIPIFVWGVVYF